MTRDRRVEVVVDEVLVSALKKLPPHRQRAVARALSKFESAPNLPSLDFRRLKGAPGYWIIDSGSGDRVILKQTSENSYRAVDVGPHDIYRRWNR